LLVDEQTGDDWIIDFGQVGRLDSEEQQGVMQFVAAVQGDDVETMANVLKRMSEVSGPFMRENLVADLKAIMKGWDGDTNYIADVVTKIFKACHPCGLQIKLSYLQLFKGIATFEATAQLKN